MISFFLGRDILMRRAYNRDLRMKLIALDPGETTGVAVFEDVELALSFQDRLGLSDMWGLLISQRPDVVACEEFRLRAESARSLVGSTFFTIELIGVIKLYCAIYKCILIMQSPACAKGLIGYAPCEGVHAKDAYRHGATCLIKDFGIPARTFIPYKVRTVRKRVSQGRPKV